MQSYVPLLCNGAQKHACLPLPSNTYITSTADTNSDTHQMVHSTTTADTDSDTHLTMPTTFTMLDVPPKLAKKVPEHGELRAPACLVPHPIPLSLNLSLAPDIDNVSITNTTCCCDGCCLVGTHCPGYSVFAIAITSTPCCDAFEQVHNYVPDMSHTAHIDRMCPFVTYMYNVCSHALLGLSRVLYHVGRLTDPPKPCILLINFGLLITLRVTQFLRDFFIHLWAIRFHNQVVRQLLGKSITFSMPVQITSQDLWRHCLFFVGIVLGCVSQVVVAEYST